MTEKSNVNFSDQAIFEEVRKSFFELVVPFGESYRAWRLLRNYEAFVDTHSDFTKENQTLSGQYHELMIRVRFVALSHLDDKELTQLFKMHFREAREAAVDLISSFKMKLLTLAVIDERDELRNAVSKALLANESILLDQPVMNIKTKQQLRRVNEFLKDYVRELGLDRVDPVRRNQFLIQEYNFEQLSTEVQNALKELFDFFEYLKISSWEWDSDEGDLTMVDDHGKISTVSKGAVEDAEKPDVVRAIEELERSGILQKGESTGEAETDSSGRILQRRWADWMAGELFREIERKRKEISAD